MKFFMAENNCVARYLAKNKSIHEKFLDFLENEENSEYGFENLIQIFEDSKILLHILVKVVNNHHLGPDFFNKIFRLLGFLIHDQKISKLKNFQQHNYSLTNIRISNIII